MLNKMMDDFNIVYDYPSISPSKLPFEKLLNLTQDEVNELYEEFSNSEFDIAAATKEALDIIYVTAQQLRAMKVDIDKGLLELHRSNTSKLVPSNLLGDEINKARERYPDAEAVHVEGDLFRLYSPSLGKVIKPMCYSPADVSGCLPSE